MLREFLEDEGFEVDETETSSDVIAAFKDGDKPPDLVLMDVRMPDKSGIDVLREASEILDEQLPFIIMTAYGTSSVAIEAMQLGAYDYITKPFDLEDVLLNVRRYFDHQALMKQVHGMRAPSGEYDPNETMIGNSPAMQEVYKTIGRVARSDSTVMITGETGTGKELVASAVHYHSGRRDKPFITINCAGFPESLLESELFGYDGGAFTGAGHRQRHGGLPNTTAPDHRGPALAQRPLHQFIYVAFKSINLGAKGDIIVNRLGEGIGSLEDHANLVAYLVRVHLWSVQVMPLKQHLSDDLSGRYQVIHPVEAAQQGALPTP
jgi:CheY-like chemotaxis protein